MEQMTEQELIEAAVQAERAKAEALARLRDAEQEVRKAQAERRAEFDAADRAADEARRAVIEHIRERASGDGR